MSLEYLSLTETENIEALCPYLGWPSEWKNNLLELGEIIRDDTELREFFLNACRTLNESRETPSFSDWSDPLVRGEARPDFFLFLSLLAVREIIAVHKERDLPEKITRETCLGVGTKSLDFFFFNHVPGTVKRAIYWFLHPMRGELFKVGRFEYMLRKASEVHETFPEKLGIDCWVLDMHIPGGGSMSREVTFSSWKEGLEFFSALYPDRKPEAVVCVSWIFSPDLPLFLPAESHLVALQDTVHIHPVTWSEIEGVPFIMGTSSENPDDWPDETSLQRAFKKHVKGGGLVRTGAMYLKKDEILDNFPG